MASAWDWLSYLSINPAAHGGVGFLEQGGVFHGLEHLAEAAGGDHEGELIGRHQRTGRWIEHSQEAAAAALAVFLCCEGHDTTAARCEARHDGIVSVVVVECPCAESR